MPLELAVKSKGISMKILKRITAILLSLIVSASLLISCDWVLFVPVEKTTEGLPDYTLTEEFVEEAKSLLKQAETTTLNNKTTVEINFAWNQFITRYYEVATQANIAFVLFVSDANNEEYEQDYLFAKGAYTDLYGLYTDSLKKIYNSSSRDLFFSEWTQEEVDSILNHDEEVVELKKEITELEVEYSGLSDLEFNDGTVEIFKQIVSKNNKIASKFGYQNYYDYATNNVYERDYKSSQLQFFRSKVATEFVSLAEGVINEFKENRQTLSPSESTLLSSILKDDYDKMGINYWEKYVNSFTSNSLKSKLNHAFANQNVTFAGEFSNAREMAFTVYLPSFNKSYCYFGPDYQNLFTVAHEIGHYSAGISLGLDSGSTDLSETHSQSNEMLLLEYLSGELSQDVYRTLKGAIIGDLLATIVVCTVIDEFEYEVYSKPSVEDYEPEDFDDIIIKYDDYLLWWR